MHLRRIEQGALVPIRRYGAQRIERPGVEVGQQPLLDDPFLDTADHEAAINAFFLERLAGLVAAVAIMAVENDLHPARIDGGAGKIREPNWMRARKYAHFTLRGLPNIKEQDVPSLALLHRVQEFLRLLRGDAERMLLLLAER